MFTGFVAAWISRITQDWMLLEMTQSVAAVGLAVTFQFAPVLLLGLWGGVLTDRFPRLRIARIAQGLTVAGLLMLMLLVMFDALAVWHIYVLAALSGLAAVAESPARSALITQMVPPHRLQTAIGLNATAFHVASLLGSAGSGILIAAFGARWAVASALASRRRLAGRVGLCAHVPAAGGGQHRAALRTARRPSLRLPQAARSGGRSSSSPSSRPSA